MRFADAPPGDQVRARREPQAVELGRRDTTRYPQTRMGVEAAHPRRFLRRARLRARRVRVADAQGSGMPPRRDLQLEALAEILDGKRLVHCHSYRQDEILMLMRVAEEFGFRIGTFQHVLEGYKVADEMAAHGAGGSSFSDWWAYKFEVYDAIPYNGAIMHDRGVVVSFNSDSSRAGAAAEHRGGEGGEVRRRAARPRRSSSSPRTPPGSSRSTAASARSSRGQGRRLRDLDRDPAVDLRALRADLDRRPQVLRSRRDLAARPAAEAERIALIAKARRTRSELESRDPKVDVAAWQPTFGVSFGMNDDAEGHGTEQGVCE